MVYRIVIEKGEDFGYIAHCPAIPGCHSQGRTLDEVVENIKGAIRGCISVMDKSLLEQNKDEIFMEVAI